MTALWFSPAPSELSASRLSLDFGLRAADLWFRERVVPELGGVRFVRQLSWPVAALALHADWRKTHANVPRPSTICHGIEALACKLEQRHDPGSGRILGSRAFKRDATDTLWSFVKLRQSTNYVRNTYRQTATRVLRVGPGLGFVTGPRFDVFALEPVGDELANAFLGQSVGTGGGSLRKWLLGWLQGDKSLPNNAATLRRALSPESPSKGECAVVHARLLEVDTPASKTRARLAAAVGRPAGLPDLETKVVPRLRLRQHEAQAKELRAALAFGAMLDRAIDVVARITELVEPAGAGIALSRLKADKATVAALKKLSAAGESLLARVKEAGVLEPDSRTFATAVAGAADPTGVMRTLITRAPELFSLADGVVGPGSLFRVVRSTEDEPDGPAAELDEDVAHDERTDRTFRVANLHALLRDLHAGSSQ